VNDHLALAEASQALREAGLESVAEAPLDGLGDTRMRSKSFARSGMAACTCGGRRSIAPASGRGSI
jgi:hypothetical protein